MKNVVLRNYKIKDKIFFKNLLYDYFLEINKNNYDYKKFEIALKEILRNAKKKKITILYKSEVIGFIVLVYSKNFVNEKICLINDFYINRENRGFKLGFFIISKLLRKLKKIKFKEFRINILSKNLIVKKFWKKFKLKERSRNYTINL